VFSIFGLWNIIKSNKFIIGPILIVFGLFFCFFGRKFIYIVQILTGILVVSFVCLYFVLQWIQKDYSELEFWLICGLCLAVGLIAGYFVSKSDKLAPCLLGGILGYVASIFVYQLALKYISLNPKVVFAIVVAVLVIIGVILGYFFTNTFIIIPTAFVGAYAIIKGIALMAGGFPDENQVMTLIEMKEWEQLHELMTPIVYVYLAAWLIIGIAGVFIQCKYFQDPGKSDADKGREDDASTPLKKDV
jgi:hypothetical protein